MTQQGAALQMYNNELVKCLEELRAKRKELNVQISVEEEEKNRLQTEINVLSEKLVKVNESLAKKLAARDEYTKTINDTELQFMKILDSSQALLGTLKKDISIFKQKS